MFHVVTLAADETNT